MSKIPAALKQLTVPVEDLWLNEDNPRVGDVEAVKRSLDRFGQRVPVVYRNQSPRPRARKRKVVIAGNHRLKAARELGWVEIAALDADDLTPDEAKAFALADNRTSDLAGYDDEMLATILDGLDEELQEAASFIEFDIIQFLARKPAPDSPDSFDEVDVDEIDLAHTCPRCGFEFDD